MKSPEMPEKVESPDELADLIDSLMNQGSGHVNIASQEGGEILVDTVNTTACCANGACMQPTENAIDEDMMK